MYTSRSTAVLWTAFGLVTLLLVAPVVALSNDSLAQQRQAFLAAEKALTAGDLVEYQRLYRQLGDYPLVGYLELQKLQRSLDKVKPAEVSRFLQAHRQTPVGDALLRSWLDLLAKREDWTNYLAFYRPQASVIRQCRWFKAKIAAAEQAEIWPQVQKLWLHGRSRPNECDPAFTAWEAAGLRTTDLTWQRIELAILEGQPGLARYLSKKLPAAERSWVELWLKVREDPLKVLDLEAFAKTHPYREKILAYGVRRRASQVGLDGVSVWEAVKDLYPFDQETRYTTHRRVALAVERDPSDRAYQFILQLTPKADDERLYTARKRAALLRQDWPQLLADVQLGPQQASEKLRWSYWEARALEATGELGKAKQLYTTLANERSYYGFLAADRIDADYHLSQSKTQVAQDLLASVGQMPGIRRALELHQLRRDRPARREWYAITKQLSTEQLKAAALLAKQQGWEDRAIFTLAQTNVWDDLELRFPLSYQSEVARQAESLELDSSWVFAVIRQESAFMRDAQSSAGALGLMQLMPGTARQVAKDLKRQPPRKATLLDAQTNIELGTNYLRELLDRLEQNPVLATAAYNAGPHRVDRWLPSQTQDADIWVDLVPFHETRRYLHRVLAYTVIYDKRQGKQPKRLRERMATIAAAAQLDGA